MPKKYQTRTQNQNMMSSQAKELQKIEEQMSNLIKEMTLILKGGFR